MSTEKERKRHAWVYRTGRGIVPLFLRKYSFTTNVLETQNEPCLVLSNHTTESDLFMVARAIRTPLYFVAGEHLLRSKLGALLKYIGDPISAPRGASRLGTVTQILKRIRQGNSVCMFPEGCRSFDGETLPTAAATAKLAKTAGGGLVTYRIHGGYFIAPRWAYTTRKGHVEGEIVRVYSSAELKAMSVPELTAALDADLYENAYEYQKTAQHRYRGKRLAEGLENYLVLCPRCGKYDTMETKGNRFRCSCCGLGGIYDEYGYLQGEELPYHSVYDWGQWMKGRFREDVDAATRDVLFTERDIRLYEVLPNHKTRDIAQGELFLYRDRMEFKAGETQRIFRYEAISEKSLLYYGKTFLFTDDTGYYGLTGEKFHAWKLDQLCER